MSQSSSTIIELSLDDVINMNISDDFLKQESQSIVYEDDNDDIQEKDTDTTNNLIPEAIDECQNPLCHRDDIELFHRYEIDSDKAVVICNHCYDQGFRFCLFTHEVKHISQLEPVLDNMYAQPSYHQNQLEHSILSKIVNYEDYFRSIGIDNPNPTKSELSVDVASSEIDQFE
jgi:hypothetical protein